MVVERSMDPPRTSLTIKIPDSPTYNHHRGQSRVALLLRYSVKVSIRKEHAIKL